MFPWESAFTGEQGTALLFLHARSHITSAFRIAGEETCPSWAATGLREIHINGDIAFAVWQFWRATQDAGLAWVNSTAWPLLQVRGVT